MDTECQGVLQSLCHVLVILGEEASRAFLGHMSLLGSSEQPGAEKCLQCVLGKVLGKTIIQRSLQCRCCLTIILLRDQGMLKFLVL